MFLRMDSKVQLRGQLGDMRLCKDSYIAGMPRRQKKEENPTAVV